MEKKKDFIINFLYIGAIITICYFAIKYLLGPLLPFIDAFIIVSVSERTIEKLTFGKLSKKTASVIFVFLLVLIISLIIYIVLYGLFKEIIRLTGDLQSNSFFEDILTGFNEYVSSLDNDGFLYKAINSISSFIPDTDALIEKLSAEYIPSVVSFILKFLSFFPSAVLFVFVLFISLFYIGYDYEKITSFFCLQFSEKAVDTITEAKSILFSTVKELFKAYFLLTFITFTQLLTGFMVLKVNYAFILASIISFVDMLPILGTGTILLPWSAVCFLLKDFKTAIGLIVLYTVISVFRQIAEPKIVGANIGLSPLLSLISIFVGLKLMGFWGLILFPIILITTIRLNEKGLIKIYRNFPENHNDKIQKTKLKFLNFKKNDKS